MCDFIEVTMLEKTKTKRVIFAAILLALGIILDFFVEGFEIPLIIIFVASWFIAGIDIIYQAIINLKNKMLLAEHFLMSIATIGALAIGEYKEAAMVMVLFQIGELLEDKAVDKSRKSITDLMNIQAPVAYRIEDSKSVQIDPEDIQVGDLLEIKAGDKVPVDGVVVKGESSLDTAALTGESIPVSVGIGDKLLSGSINGDGWLVMKAESTAENSTAMRIIELLEEATENQAQTESMITRFAKIYTPIVVVLAILLAFIPPLIIEGAQFSEWFRRGLIFLVVSCPCAFVVSVPMAFVTGLGISSKLGILVKGGNVFEKLVQIDTLAVDKTGTITEGAFKVFYEHPQDDVDKSLMLSITKELEKGSNHPIAQAIRKYAEDKDHDYEAVEFGHIENVPGRGLKSLGEKEEYILGNLSYMEEHDLIEPAIADGCVNEVATMVHVARIKPDKKYLGHYVIKDMIKEDAKEIIESIHTLGIDKVVMLTGDAKNVAEDVAKRAGIDEIHSELLPQGKMSWVVNKTNEGRKIAFAGDGLNDAPVITASHVGIAMGGIGSDAAIEASDVVLIKDDLKSIPRVFKIAKHTVGIAKQNIWLSLGIKLIFLILSAFGLTAMWMAVFADVGVTLLAIANSFRLYLLPKKI